MSDKDLDELKAIAIKIAIGVMMSLALVMVISGGSVVSKFTYQTLTETPK
ncbi:hypothetical protein [Chamaesiphon sp.]